MFLKELLFLLIILQIGNYGYANEDVKLATQFAFNFYHAVFKENENIVLCMWSLRYILALFYQHAEGTTEKELADLMHLNNKIDMLRQHSLFMKNYENDTNFKVINKFWYQKELKVQDSFKFVCNAYNTNIEEIDFENRKQSSDSINKWIEEKSNNKIQSIVEPDDLFDIETLMLSSSLFNAQWEQPFDTEEVYAKIFTGTNGIQYNVNMMISSRKLYYSISNELKSKIIELPFDENTQFTFWIILPNELNNFNKIKDKLTADLIRKIDRNFQLKNVELYLPKFEITTFLNTAKTLKKLGLNSLFKKDELNILKGNRTLIKLDGLHQKLTIKIDVNGTESALKIQIPSDEVIEDEEEFHCIKPFVFLILTTSIQRDIIYIGHFAKP